MHYKKFIKELNVKNTDLPVLASETAVYLENYLHNLSYEDKAIQYLSRLLDDATHGKTPLAMEISNNYVLGNAISKTYPDKIETDKEIVLKIRQISKELKNFKKISQTQQKNLVDFCINLSRELRDYQRQFSFRHHASGRENRLDNLI